MTELEMLRQQNGELVRQLSDMRRTLAEFVLIVRAFERSVEDGNEALERMRRCSPGNFTGQRVEVERRKEGYHAE